jgi:hypothetical protein
MDQSKLERLKEQIKEQAVSAKYSLFDLNRKGFGGSVGAMMRSEEIDTLYRVLEMIAEVEKEND